MDFMSNREGFCEDSDEPNNNAERDEPNSSGLVPIEKEHMFDKVVTPSDVGKLNRLVIPKQHAEKYFPLDASTNEKGLLLNFEDRNGKPWRFRYSYWNSSQSYVMTKGWSRFVKDKKLDAGDIVSFHRGVGELGKDRLYIDWRRRPDAPHPHLPPSMPSFGNNFFISPLPRADTVSQRYPVHQSIPWSPLLLRPPTTQQFHHSLNNVNLYPYRSSYDSGGGGGSSYNPGNSVIYLRPAAPPLHGGGDGGGGAGEQMVFESVPVVHGKAAAKRLRLFGVNMDCPISDDRKAECSGSTIAASDSQLSSSAAASNPHLQLRLYSGSPMQANFLDKGKAPSSSSSLDLDM